MQIIKRINLDLNRGMALDYIEIHQGERDSRYLEANITNDGAKFTIPNTFTAYVNAKIDNLLVAENVECVINPDTGDTSIVLIPITRYMSERCGKLTLNLIFVEENSTVTAQIVNIKVIKNIVEGTENIYTDIAEVNTVLAETVSGETVNGVLDKERLNKLPTMLDEIKTAVEETEVETIEPYYYDDVSESVTAVYNKGHTVGYAEGREEASEELEAIELRLAEI